MNSINGYNVSKTSKDLLLQCNELIVLVGIQIMCRPIITNPVQSYNEARCRGLDRGGLEGSTDPPFLGKVCIFLSKVIETRQKISSHF